MWNRFSKHFTVSILTLCLLGVSIDILILDSKETLYTAPSVQSLCPGASSQKRRVLSYCLFGNNSFNKYSKQVKEFVKEAVNLTMYREWGIRLYHEGIIPTKFITNIQAINPNVDFCDVRDLQFTYPNMTAVNGRIWRFVPMADETLDVTCVRDVDSPLILRDEEAVKEWLQSNKLFHCMRDNIYHYQEILGGMWCFRNSKNRTLGKTLMWKMYKSAARRTPFKEAKKSNDQDILRTIVWPAVVDDILQHDSFYCREYKGSSPFPTQRRKMFIGCRRPCKYHRARCPKSCRPINHTDWLSC